MRIEVRGRNTPVADDLHEHVERRFRKIASQVSEQALLTVEISEDRRRGVATGRIADATLHLKGVTLRARDVARDAQTAINECADELSRQVKRNRDKRRARRVRPEAPTVSELGLTAESPAAI